MTVTGTELHFVHSSYALLQLLTCIVSIAAINSSNYMAKDVTAIFKKNDRVFRTIGVSVQSSGIM